MSWVKTKHLEDLEDSVTVNIWRCNKVILFTVVFGYASYLQSVVCWEKLIQVVLHLVWSLQLVYSYSVASLGLRSYTQWLSGCGQHSPPGGQTLAPTGQIFRNEPCSLSPGWLNTLYIQNSFCHIIKIHCGIAYKQDFEIDLIRVTLFAWVLSCWLCLNPKGVVITRAYLD